MKLIINTIIPKFWISRATSSLVLLFVLYLNGTISIARDTDDLEGACEGNWGRTIVVNGLEVNCVKDTSHPGPSTSGGGSSGGGGGGVSDVDDGGPNPGGGIPVTKGTPQQCTDKADDCIDAHIGRPDSVGDIEKLRRKTGKSCFTENECALLFTNYEKQNLSHNGTYTLARCRYCLITNTGRKFACATDVTSEAKKVCRDALLNMLKEIARINVVEDWRGLER